MKLDIADTAKWMVKDYFLGKELPRRYARAQKEKPFDPRKVLFVQIGRAHV